MNSQTLTQIVEQATPQLQALSKPEFAKSKERFFKHDIQSAGISMPELRTLAKHMLPNGRLQDPDIVIAACDHFLQSDYHEYRLFGLILLSRSRAILPTDVFGCAETWFTSSVNDWALVDELCGGTLYHVMVKHPECLDYLKQWNVREDMWLRRASVVVLVKFARKGMYLDAAYAHADALASAPEDLIHKASGWLLREAGKTDPERLRQYLLANGKHMSRTSVRYAIEHFEERERKELLELTRR